MFAKVAHKTKLFNFNQIFLAHYIRFYRRVRIFGISASALLIAIMTLAIFPLVNKTESAEAAPGVGTPSTTVLTMTSGRTSANVDLLVKDTSGTFASSSDTNSAKFGVTTDNYTGYELSITGSNNTKQLSNSTTGSVLKSIEYPTPLTAFESTASYNGQWGYLPSKYDSVDNTVFRPSPTSASSTTLNKTTCANGSSTTCPNESDEYTIALGARVNHNNPAGTYTNTFILNAVGNPAYYTIKYQDNTGDSTVSNLPSTQSGENPITSTNINLSSTIPTRTNFTFLYWCDGTVSNNGTSCSGTTYNKGASFGIDQTTKNETTLYAVWSPNITIKTNTGISSVSLNGTSCAKTEGCTVTGLVYGQSYTLTATIATGYSFNSWNPGSFGTITNSSTSGSTNTATYTVGAGSSTITPTATINSYLQTVMVRYQDASGNYGSYSTYSACTKNINYGQTHSCSIAATTVYKAASLASYTVTSTNTKYIDVARNSYTITVSNSNTSSGKSSFTVYYGGSNTTTVTPSSGYYLSGVSCPSGYTCSGYNTGSSYTGQQTVTVKNNNTASGGTLGFSGTLSCQSSISGTMQDFNPCSNISATSGSLTDSRDNQVYTVAKINGNWWMTRNLAIGCKGSGSTYSATINSITLTSSTSNVLSNYTTPTSSVHSDTYTEGKIVCNATYGAWYNYYAASAGTISGSSNNTEDTYNICPKGWTMPTDNQAETIGTGDSTYASAFSPIAGGYYSNGSRYDAGYGYWWSRTAGYDYTRHVLYYHKPNLDTNYTTYYLRYGYYIRCVRA